jgi:predicted type IV restriction endonuclease
LDKIQPTHATLGFLKQLIQQDVPLTRLKSDHESIFEKVEKIIRDANTESTVNSFPFETFWDNPIEPRHSKLIAHFINPSAAHQCGQRNLELFFKSLRLDTELPMDGWEVSPEEELSWGRVDILARNKRNNRIVIIENKINGAQDQDVQLERYINCVLGDFKPISLGEITVVYLPLRKGERPSKQTIGAIETDKLQFAGIQECSFEEQILTWLEDAIKAPAQPLGMRENLTHYRNLIRYRINKDKKMKTKFEIIQSLKQDGKTYNYCDFIALRDSVSQIVEAYKLIELVDTLASFEKRINKGGNKFHFYYNDDINGFWDKPLEMLSENNDDFETIYQDHAIMIGRPVLSKTKAVLTVVVFHAWIQNEKLCTGIGDRSLMVERDSGYQALVSSQIPFVELSDATKVAKTKDGCVFHWQNLEQFEIGLKHNNFDKHATDLISYYDFIAQKVKEADL